MKLDILAFAAHPDDVELACSGTLIHHIKKGYKAGVVDLTRGELGTRGTPEIRAEESKVASAILGISVRENLNMKDGFFVQDEEHLMKLIQVIRKYRPHIVFANAISDRHIDHGRAAKLEADACFLSGLRKIETFDADGKPQEAWRPKNVYHYIQDNFIKPDLVVDITNEWEQKMECIRAFKSQFYDPASGEPETPISSRDFMDFLPARSLDFGRIIGARYGEGFTTRTPGVDDLMLLK